MDIGDPNLQVISPAFLKFTKLRILDTPIIITIHSRPMATELNPIRIISNVPCNLVAAMGIKFDMSDEAVNSLLDRVIEECDNLDQMADRLGASLNSRH